MTLVDINGSKSISNPNPNSTPYPDPNPLYTQHPLMFLGCDKTPNPRTHSTHLCSSVTTKHLTLTLTLTLIVKHEDFF